MKWLVAVLALVAAVSAQRPHDICRTCELILNIAEHHFHNNITDKAQLQTQLLRECHQIHQTPQDQQACVDLVNTNIDKIYSDLQAGDRVRYTCFDIGACVRPTTPAPSAIPVRRVKRQGGNNPCRTCEQIINIAEHHFHNNISDQAALQAQLLQECQWISQHEGQQAGQDCTNLVNNNIATIFADLKAGKRPRQTCEDIGSCQPRTTPHPMEAEEVHRVKRQGGGNQCRTCEQIINIAEHHFHNNISDQAALQAQLLQECQYIAQHEGQQAGQDCTNLVNNNIAKIFADLSAGKRPRQTCEDIGVCQGRTTPHPMQREVRRVKRQGGNNPCRTCEQIINIAEHHFHNNISDQAALQAQLLQECQWISQHEGQQAGQDCTNLVNNNIATIFADLKAGKRPRQTCEDIGSCQPRTTPHPMEGEEVHRVKRQGGGNQCRTCEQIINIAEHHFHNNISDQAALQAQLLQECQWISQHEGQQAGQDCTNIVNNNIATIFADLQAGKRPRQTCEDIGICHGRTTPHPMEEEVHRVKRQGGNNPCRTCEQILNIAEHHFHNNITDQAALQAQLQQECTRLGQHEGQQAAQDCANLVNNNIATIFADLSAGKRPRQTCEDIGACQARTTPAAFLDRRH